MLSEPSRLTTLTYAQAVNAALARALAVFPEAILFGEDVAVQGGVFACTKGLAARFGNRVFDTPISESALLGGALGAALLGRRPIVEVMYGDFFWVAFDQLINQAANTRYISRGQLSAPLTVRTQQGALPGSCAQHSQSLEAIFAHVPGLRVAVPSTAEDAFTLLLAAIADPDPVIVIESRRLYYTVRGGVDVEAPIERIGGAQVANRGEDVTIVAWGSMLHEALRSAEHLEVLGISAEVIDPRWINPFDEETVVDSVRRTGRLVVAHEANVSGGFGAEIAARVTHAAWGALKAPVERVGLPDVRVPAAPSLQEALFPNADHISAAVHRVLGAPSMDVRQ